MVRYKGVYYFYDDGHEKCFRGMKVKPLSRTFKGLHAGITGQRKDESLVNGSSILVVQREDSFGGIDVGIDRLVKSNSVTDVDMCRFFRAMNVPVNSSLRASGYVIVVCELCVSQVLPWPQEREGKWWWEDDIAKEYGLYKEQIKPAMARLGEHRNGVGSLTNGYTTIAGAFNAPCFGIRQAMEESYVELALRNGAYPS